MKDKIEIYKPSKLFGMEEGHLLKCLETVLTFDVIMMSLKPSYEAVLCLSDVLYATRGFIWFDLLCHEVQNRYCSAP